MIYEFGSKQKCLFILFLIFSGLEKFKGYEKINISPFIIMMHRMQWQKNNGIYHVLLGVYMKYLTTRKVIFKLLHRPTRQFVGCLTKIVNFKCFEQPKYLASKTCYAYIDINLSSNNQLHDTSSILNSWKKVFLWNIDVIRI